MDLDRAAREYYDLGITTTPAVAAGWELSVDGGATWTTGETVDGGARWLVSGPDFTPDAGDATASVTVPATMKPKIRAVDNSEVIIREAPAIRLD